MSNLRARDIAGTLVYTTGIGPVATVAADAALRAMDGVTSSRRRAEIAATYSIISEIFGPRAAIGHDSAGAPYVEGAPRVHISISHCADMVAVAVNPDKMIGVDIELWRPKLLKVKDRFLTADESRRIASPRELLQAWTVKEAVYKAARIPGLPLLDIRLPHPGCPMAAAIGNDGMRWFNVYPVESTGRRAITLVTP